jgi:hypothetical protein
MDTGNKKSKQHTQQSQTPQTKPHTKNEKRSDDDARKRGRTELTQGEVDAIRANQGSGHS